MVEGFKGKNLKFISIDDSILTTSLAVVVGLVGLGGISDDSVNRVLGLVRSGPNLGIEEGK